MKKLFIILIALALMPFVTVNAQDARGRVASTVVADALAQLPAQTPQQYNQIMGELASTGSEGIAMLGAMLKPAGEGVKNATMEYALNGVAAFVSDKSNASLRAGVREGLKAAVAKVGDNTNKAFLMTVLQECGATEDAEFFAGFLGDEYLGNFAARALAALPADEALVLKLMQEQSANGFSKTLLAQIASYKHIPEAEDLLIAWQKGATEQEAQQINRALASCGNDKALKALAAAAKNVGYAFENTDAYGSYAALATRLIAENPAAAEKAAKTLMKVADCNVRSTGLEILSQIKGAGVMPLIISAMKDSDREYRAGALRLTKSFADDNVYAAIGSKTASYPDAVKVDVLNWLGTVHAASQIDAVMAQIDNADEAVSDAAIRAASKIGGDKALEALIAKSMDENNSEAITSTLIKALLSFNGRVNDGIVKALDGNDMSRTIALAVLQKRHIAEAADKVLAMAKTGNKSAVSALPSVASQSNFDALCDMLEQTNGDNGSVAAAITNAIKALPAEKQVELIEARMAKAGAKAHLYYGILADTGNAKAFSMIVAGYKSSTGEAQASAFNGLLGVNDDSVIEAMYEIATTSSDRAEAAFKHFLALTKASSKLNPQQKYMNYRRVLEANPNTAIKNNALAALSATQTYQGMMLAAEYLDNAETAQAAANTVLEIATKHPDFYSAEVKALLEKVGTILNDGDAVYKRKDIEKFISENTAREQHSIITTLSPEEQAEGFEVLFDGVSMDKWTGNTTAYQPIDGYMYVTAAYGSTGNLYTKKEYSDFVLRFEFCFDRAGVNNGVGIRTPMGVDAAYQGMELQILDHDDPIYANLREYQVHGSVYGIIPAKRMVSPELGVWNTEEIRAKGDRITVIVNGEVLLDGNIRKACQGHNVAPDGSNNNPYTVDHLNHPGLFNKTGHIGFLGHGEGVKFRNVRVKEL